MANATQIKSASQAIKAAGYEPTEDLINAVMAERVKDQRVSYATATARVLSTQTTEPDNGQSSGQRVTDNGQNGQSQTGSNVQATELALAKKMKQEIVTNAFAIALTEILAGDLGEMAVELPLDATGALDVDFSQVFSQPKFRTLPSAQQSLRALPSNAGSKQGLSLPSSEMQSESKLNNLQDLTEI